MKLHFTLLLLIAIILSGCQAANPQATCSDYDEMADEPQTISVVYRNCPFNHTFAPGPFMPETYFTIKEVRWMLQDSDCNDAFEEQYDASSYLCFIKRAEPLSQAGRDDQGHQLWQWRIDCGCSYQ